MILGLAVVALASLGRAAVHHVHAKPALASLGENPSRFQLTFDTTASLSNGEAAVSEIFEWAGIFILFTETIEKL